MFYFHETVYLLKRIYKKIVADMLDLTRGRVEIPPKTPGEHRKRLILDMEWHRWGLKEHEIREYLYGNKVLSGYAEFIRIKREDIFSDEQAYPGVNARNYKDISFEGFNLWGICKATIAAKILAVKPAPDNEEHFRQVSKIYGSAAKGISRLKELFDELEPDSVFICQGGIYDSRCIVEVARDRGINVVGIENSMLGGYVLLDNLSGQIINRHSLARIGAELLETRTVSEEDRRKAYEFWEENLSKKAQEHKTGGMDDEEEIRKALNIDKNKKVLLLLGQVRTDASIVLDSDLYDDPVDMITDVVDHVKHLKDTILVIRLHPKEFIGGSPMGVPYDRITYRCLIKNGVDKVENVRIVEDTRINTYSLMRIADAGITINSQSGLEMLLLGKPVMVCGSASYGNKGFTVDLGHVAGLGACIDHLLNREVMSEEKKRMALDFFHFFCQRHMFDHKLSGKDGRLARIFRLPV
jgi:hypothetical protein